MAAVPSALAILLSLVVAGVFILVIGRDPVEVLTRFASQTFGSWYGVGQVLFKATPLIFTGLSAAVAFRAGLFNIGAEGQLAVGALVTAWIGFTLPNLNGILLLPLCLIGGILGGALWGAIPGFLKARFGAHEVINTIMMNFIAAALISWFVNNIFAVSATIHTPPVGNGAMIPRLESWSDVFHGSAANLSILLALSACGLFYYLVWLTRFGYELRAAGLNLHAARYGGINVERQTVVAMAIAGAFAGLVGSNFILGYKHYYELGFSENTGFIGIAVALLGRNHPVGIVLAALLFGVLEYGGLTVNTIVPKEIVNILQAIIIFFMIVTTKLFDRWMLSLKKSVA